MSALIQWWLIANAMIAVVIVAKQFLPSIPLNRREQIELNVMTTLRLMKVQAGWGLVADKDYPHTVRFTRLYKIVQVPIERSLANLGEQWTTK